VTDLSPDGEFIPVSKPYLWGNEAAYVNTAIEEGWLSSRGRFVDSFERTFAEKLDTKFAAAVCNGTAALHLAMATLDIKPGDEVIVPDFCMISPVLAVLYCGATPVPVEVDETWNINPDLIEEKISARTRAILVVHNYGHPAAVDKISALARRHNLYLVEDCAEALGATVNGRKIGTFGDLACFSFYANKVITTGEGGMVITQNQELYERARWKRDLCFGSDDETRFIHREIGYNFRLTNMQAAVGVAQLEHFDEAVASKIDIARRYNSALKDVAGLTLPPEASWARNVYWVYGILVEPESRVSRAALQQYLCEMSIETRRFFTPIHQQPIIGRREADTSYPHSTHLAAHGIYLPSYIGMRPDAVARVADAIRTIL
jgi:perosamine synthetase